MTTAADSEIETQRLESIAERDDPHVLENAAPGSFYAHEALHMAGFLLNSFDEQVMHHPAVLRDPRLYRIAFMAHALLYEVYQSIGDVHLDATSEDPNVG